MLNHPGPPALSWLYTFDPLPQYQRAERSPGQEMAYNQIHPGHCRPQPALRTPARTAGGHRRRDHFGLDRAEQDQTRTLYQIGGPGRSSRTSGEREVRERQHVEQYESTRVDGARIPNACNRCWLFGYPIPAGMHFAVIAETPQGLRRDSQGTSLPPRRGGQPQRGNFMGGRYDSNHPFVKPPAHYVTFTRRHGEPLVLPLPSSTRPFGCQRTR